MIENQIDLAVPGAQDTITINYFHTEKDQGGIPTLCLHGLGRTANDFEAFAQYFQEFQRLKTPIYALDFPAHGKSNNNIGSGDLSFLTNVVLQFLERLDLERVHLVAHSMGNAVALDIMRQCPEKIASLVSLCGVGLGVQVNMIEIKTSLDYLEASVPTLSLNSMRVLADNILPVFATTHLYWELPLNHPPILMITGNKDSVIQQSDPLLDVQQIIVKARHHPLHRRSKEIAGLTRIFQLKTEMALRAALGSGPMPSPLKKLTQ